MPTSSPRVSCLLHCGPLSSGQRLEVRVQGNRQTGHPEDDEHVFSWQCVRGEEIRLTLWQNSRPSREWFGCWNGEAALLHAGTLPVQVTFAGKPQPEADPADIVPLLEPSRHNGHTAASHQETPVDLLVLAQPPVPNEKNSSDDHNADHAARADNRQSGEQPVSVSLDAVAGSVSKTEHSENQSKEERATSPLPQVPAGTQIATWYAETENGEVSLEGLTTRLAQMPSKTLLVDLRQHPRKTAHSREAGARARHVLRQTFGARYFDRGWAIRTTKRPHPDQARARWQCVVTNPQDPEGIGLLIDRLCRGYSLLLFDRIASYEESTRAAVVAELQQHVGNLTCGHLA